MSVIRGPWVADYSTVGGYKTGRPGETGTHAEASMRLVDRFFIWTDRLSERALAGGLAGFVACFWFAFGVGAWWVFRLLGGVQ